MEKKYDIPVQLVNVMELDKEGVSDIFSNVLKEFPVKEINIDMPQWIEELDSKHWLKVNIMSALKDMSGEITKVRDITKILENLDGLENLSAIKIKEMKMGDGTSRLDILPKKELFYKILGETCSIDIKNESQLLKMMESFYKAKVEYDKIKDALIDVNNTGYGLVAPQLSEMKLEVPELINSGARKGIKLKASAPSLHIIRADVETEVPIVGTEKQSEDFYKAILDQFENDPSQIWQSNMFGKPLEEIVKEGLQSKLYKMPDDVQNKLQRTLQKIINEGSGGLICIIL